MKSDTMKYMNNRNIINKANCIIFATIMMAIFMQSCGSIQSPKGNRIKQNTSPAKPVASKVQAKQSNNPQESSVSEIENFINNVKSNENNKLDKKNNANKNSTTTSAVAKAKNSDTPATSGGKDLSEARIPTIREQMHSLAKDQVSIKQDVNLLQDDLSDIKQSLRQIQTAVAVQQSQPDRYPDRGDGQKAKVNNQISANHSYNNNNNSNNSGRNISERISSDEDSEYESNLGASNYNDHNNDYNNSAAVESDEVVEKQRSTKPVQAKVAPKPAPVTIKKNPAPAKIKKIAQNEPVKPKAPVAKKEANNFNAATKITPQESTSTEETVSTALNSFKRQDYKTAINELNKIMAKQTDATSQATCSYWIGESYFRMGNYSSALRFFDKTLSIAVNTKKEEAKIMTAECQVRLGNTKEAKLCFQQFINAYPKSRYLPRAKKFLQQL